MSSSSTSKPAKRLTAILKLSPRTLSQFPHHALAAQPSPASKLGSTPEASPAPTMPDAATTTTTAAADSPAAALNGASTPSSLAAPVPGSTWKPAASKAGTKRGAAALDGASNPRARAKPGPKKRKLGDAINDPNLKTPFAGPTPLQKLGPKANQGAINAGLRALDRTGKFKCRKWEKKGFKLRSFTGVVWDVPSWKPPTRSSAFSDHLKADSTGSSDTKLKDESSAVSDRSVFNRDAATPLRPPVEPLDSSPVPVPAA